MRDAGVVGRLREKPAEKRGAYCHHRYVAPRLDEELGAIVEGVADDFVSLL